MNFNFTDEEFDNIHFLWKVHAVQFDFWQKYYKEFAKRKKKQVIDNLRNRG